MEETTLTLNDLPNRQAHGYTDNQKNYDSRKYLYHNLYPYHGYFEYYNYGPTHLHDSLIERYALDFIIKRNFGQRGKLEVICGFQTKGDMDAFLDGLTDLLKTNTQPGCENKSIEFILTTKRTKLPVITCDLDG